MRYLWLFGRIGQLSIGVAAICLVAVLLVVASGCTSGPSASPSAKPASETPKSTAQAGPASVVQPGAQPAQPAAPTAAPAAAAPTQAPAAPSGTVTLLKGSLRGEDWLCPACDNGSLINMEPVMEPLLELDQKTGRVAEPGGRLAERWEHSADWTTYTFYLRKGVQFHDGWGEMTAEDVKFSWELVTRPTSKNPGAQTFRNLEVEVIDPYKVVFRQKKVDLTLTRVMVEMPMNFPIASKKYVTTVGEAQAAKQAIGTGPFKLKRHEPGVSITYEAVPNHWRKAPAIQTLIFKVVPEVSTQLAMLKTGQADVIALGSYDLIPEVEAAKLRVIPLKAQTFPAVYLLGQYLKPTYPESARPAYFSADPQKNHNIRKALSLAIDRQEIVKSVLRGRGSAEGACVQAFFSFQPGYDPSCKVDPYDTEGAKKLLAEAGFAKPSDLKITMDLAPHAVKSYNKTIAEAVAQMWRAVGVDVKTQQSEWSRVEQMSTQRAANFAFINPLPIWPVAAEMLGYYTRTTDRLAYTGEDLEQDRLINEALAATTPADIEKRNRALFDFEYKNMYAIPIAYADLIYATNSKLDWPLIQQAAHQSEYNFEYMTLSR